MADEIERYVVVDTETTGLGKLDRVIEIAAVVVDGSTGDVVDEFDTLVNPMRDVGRTDIHGLTPSMLSAAPTFEEVIPALARWVDGGVLVAHNLRFDQRMLVQEFDRTDVDFDPGRGICTLNLTGSSLQNACSRYGIVNSHAHRALGDARATAEVLSRFLDEGHEVQMATLDRVPVADALRTLRRDSVDRESPPLPLHRLTDAVAYPSTDEAILSYLDALNWVLDDLVIDAAERIHLHALAVDLDLDVDAIGRAHRAYFNSLVIGAQRDGIITSDEYDLLSTVAYLLELGDVDVPAITEQRSTPTALREGLRVCFTGTAVVDGEQVLRSDIEEAAAMAGLQPVGSVTKQTDLLVCADPTSMSGKARKARDYGVAIMSFDGFIAALGYSDNE